MGRLENKTAVITGAATGIGQATAEVFANEGARVIIGDINKDQMEETVDAIRKNGGQAESFHLDVSDENSVKAFAMHAERLIFCLIMPALIRKAERCTNIRLTCLTALSLSTCAAHSFAANI
ncbi:putative oxidoreductase Rv0769 [Bacillus subtilis]|nr:putative oxidoreductase Rv0769 [Bacillus subtilis]